MGAIIRDHGGSVTISIRDSKRYCKVNPPFSNYKLKRKRAAPRLPVPYVSRNGKIELY